MKNFKKILNLLSIEERKQASLLLLTILIMAILEMVGVASILPFMAVLTNPEVIETNFFLNSIYQFTNTIGIKNYEQFLFFLGFSVFILLIISIIFKAITTYAQIKFVQVLQYNINKRLMKRYLSQSFSWFLSHNSADFGKTILSETGIVIGNGVNLLIQLVSKAVIAIALLFLLILANPTIAITVGLSFGIIYVLVYKFTNGYVTSIGDQRFKKNQQLFRVINEAFSAIKEVKMGGLEENYIKRFSDPAKIIVKTSAYSSVVEQLPRFAMEAVAFGGIMVLILFQMKYSGSFNNAIPIISLYAFVGYRLMPALQGIYGSLSKFDFIIPSLNKIYYDHENLNEKNFFKAKKKLSFNKSINLINIDYKYPNASRTTLKNINLSISVNSTVGLVGPTGSGKTTTVDIILGLLEPTKGNLLIDKNIITKKNLRAWHQSLGYVPQYIYLSDNTVASNIAFGVENVDINQDDVEKAAKIANLHDFVINELPEKYQTIIGERGVRLSGGQRQRIGIARALYHNPKVLILDEATNALDNLTEKVVMEALSNLGKNITIILVAHRLNTVKKCDKIFYFEKGELKDEGTFEELIKVNENFRLSINNLQKKNAK
jgi:ATP-binding cassette, subfamily B, bacterial PglK